LRGIALQAGDFNGDGRVDLLATTLEGSPATAAIALLSGNGDGSFGTPVVFPLGLGFAAALAAADIDGDGDLDVVALANADATSSGTAHVLTGDGAGAFVQVATFAAGVNASDVVLADLNHDSRPDVALAAVGPDTSEAIGTVQVRLGDGAGGFGPPVFSQDGPNPQRITAADFNGDGDVDLAVSRYLPSADSGEVSILRGDGSGQFMSSSTVPILGGAAALAAAEMTGDGNLDLIVSGILTNGSNQVRLAGVLPGDGAGGFRPPAYVPVRNGTDQALADFDRDGRLDIAAADLTDSRVSVLLSMCGNVADLALTTTDLADPVPFGTPITYFMNVTNNGPDTASAMLSVVVPSTMSVQSVIAPGGSCLTHDLPDRTIRCLVGDVPAASSKVVTVILNVGSAGEQTIAATVATGVDDPVPGNDSVTESTFVTVPGGTGLTITPAPGGARLTWTDGDAESGYVIGRAAGGVVTRIPATGLLPADATSYVDSTATPGMLNCYQVLPMANDFTPIGQRSDMLCVVPDSASPPGAISEFHLEFRESRSVSLRWNAFSGHVAYLLVLYRASGTTWLWLPEEMTGFSVNIEEPTCYVLVPVDEVSALAHSAMLCGVPRDDWLRVTAPPTNAAHVTPALAGWR
jgi:hypothetical protein